MSDSSQLEAADNLRIWLSGGTGYLGSHFLHSSYSHAAPLGRFNAPPSCHIHYTWHYSPPLDRIPTQLPGTMQITNEKVDLTLRQQTIDSIINFKPNVIIHTAALSVTALCEKNPELAYKVNVDGTRYVVEAIQLLKQQFDLSCHLVHMSSSWVYSGEQQFVEEDSPQAQGFQVYGKTKLQSEQIIQSCLPPSDFTILRMAVMYGAPSPLTSKPSFLQFFFDFLKQDSPGVDLFTDEFISPIYIGDVVEILRNACNEARRKQLVERRSSRDERDTRSSTTVPRVFNMGGPDRLTKYQIGILLCGYLNVPTTLIRPVTHSYLQLASSRPGDLSMNNSRLIQYLNVTPMKFEMGILQVLRQMGIATLAKESNINT